MKDIPFEPGKMQIKRLARDEDGRPYTLFHGPTGAYQFAYASGELDTGSKAPEFNPPAPDAAIALGGVVAALQSAQSGELARV